MNARGADVRRSGRLRDRHRRGGAVRGLSQPIPGARASVRCQPGTSQAVPRHAGTVGFPRHTLTTTEAARREGSAVGKHAGGAGPSSALRPIGDGVGTPSSALGSWGRRPRLVGSAPGVDAPSSPEPVWVAGLALVVVLVAVLLA